MEENQTTPSSIDSNEAILPTKDSRQEWVKPEKHPMKLNIINGGVGLGPEASVYRS